MTRTVILKFEGETIRTELPIPNLFTGQVQLVFNWKQGKLMTASASRTANVEISTDSDTLQRGEDMV